MPLRLEGRFVCVVVEADGAGAVVVGAPQAGDSALAGSGVPQEAGRPRAGTPTGAQMGSMPTPPHTPPPPLRGRPFTLDDARAAGLTRGQLAGRAYANEGRGLWSCEAHPPPEPAPGTASPKASPLQAVTPGAVISHVTAAQLLGLRLPARLRTTTPLHLTQTGGRSGPRRRGTIGHRAHLADEDMVRAAGVLVTGPTRTVVDLAGMRLRAGRALLTDDDLVVLLDGVIQLHATGPLAGRGCLRTKPAVAEDLERMVNVRGVARVREALERAMPAVDSALETRMRLLLVAFGLTGWVTDLELSPRGHRRVWPDLADVELRLALQIDGPHHDDLGQARRDIDRARATAAAGWQEIRLTSRDMIIDGPGSLPEAVRLVRSARRAYRPRRSDSQQG